MTFTLEDSMKDRKWFPKLLAMAISALTVVYVLFGFFGYIAYGDETKDIMTLNLPRDWTDIAIILKSFMSENKMPLCLLFRLVCAWSVFYNPYYSTPGSRDSRRKPENGCRGFQTFMIMSICYPRS